MRKLRFARRLSEIALRDSAFASFAERKDALSEARRSGEIRTRPSGDLCMLIYYSPCELISSEKIERLDEDGEKFVQGYVLARQGLRENAFIIIIINRDRTEKTSR